MIATSAEPLDLAVAQRLPVELVTYAGGSAQRYRARFLAQDRHGLWLHGFGADGRAVNVASGRSASILEVAAALTLVLGKEIEPELTGKFRAGDIRHCFADATLARETLGFEAEVALDDGMAELAGWLEGQVATDRFDEAAAELSERGLTT